VNRGAQGPAEHSLVLVNSDRFPDGTPVDLAAVDARGRRPAGWLVDVRYRACDGTVLRAEVSGAVAVPVAPLWFAEIAHATSGVPSSSLLAFAGAAYPAGTLVGPHEVARRGLRMGDRVAELRWWTRSGVVENVQVEPVFRRQGIGRVLVTVAEGLAAVRGWAPLTGDGRLTDAGARWLAGAPVYWRPRLAERTARLSDDDEPDGLTGVARLLR
jgi:GNAT superfamily N-acetyltransferase